MAKMSVQVQNRSANAAFVVSSHVEHRGAVVAGLLAHNASLPEEERVGEETVRGFLDWLASTMRHKTETMVAAEMAYVDEQADDPIVRERRDQAVGPLITCMTRVRSYVSAVLGEAGLATYGLRDVVPRQNPATLSEYARVVARLLRTHPRSQSDGIGGTFDTEVLASSIDQARAPLAEALDEMVVEQRQLEGAMLARDRAAREWNEIYVNGATTFASLYRLAGRGDLADRVRPTVRRSEGRDAPPVDAAPGSPPGGEPDAPVDVPPVAAPDAPASALTDDRASA